MGCRFFPGEGIILLGGLCGDLDIFFRLCFRCDTVDTGTMPFVARDTGDKDGTDSGDRAADSLHERRNLAGWVEAGGL